jgi:muramoyltetrapeptide carboxypeptidase LdcA involved in peptidoglycan recycling
MRLDKGDKIGIVACSNPLEENIREEVEEILLILKELGLETVISPYLYSLDTPILLRGKLCGDILMSFYRDSEIKAIFDISGGDTANEVLDYLDYDVIMQNPKTLFGYSDLTSVLNGIYCKSKISNVLFQIKNLCKDETGVRNSKFYHSLFQGSTELYDFSYEFIQGNNMEGVVIGGNIRCFLKLAGTSYLPDVTGKILLLESCRGEIPLMISFLNQLKQMGVFQKIKGIILGTFTEMDKKELKPDITNLLVQILDNSELPIVRTKEIGHSRYSAAIGIGEYINLK